MLWWIGAYVGVGWLLVEGCHWSYTKRELPLKPGAVLWVLLGWPLILPFALLALFLGGEE